MWPTRRTAEETRKAARSGNGRKGLCDVAREASGGALGAVALSIAVAGCTIHPGPSEPVGTVVTFEATPPPQPAEDLGRADWVPDGYIDLGYGQAVPIDSLDGCEAPADLFIGVRDGEVITEILLPENLVDTGPREFARGEVGYDDEGRIATYTVAPGDVEGVIGERLCIFNGSMIPHLNGHPGWEPIQPGEVLVINPDAVPGFVYEDPYD